MKQKKKSNWFFGDFRKKHKFWFWFLIVTFIGVILVIAVTIIGIIVGLIALIMKPIKKLFAEILQGYHLSIMGFKSLGIGERIK